MSSTVLGPGDLQWYLFILVVVSYNLPYQPYQWDIIYETIFGTRASRNFPVNCISLLSALQGTEYVVPLPLFALMGRKTQTDFKVP